MSTTMANNMDLVQFLETDHKSLLRPNDIAKIFGISIETIYDWKYRAKMKKILRATRLLCRKGFAATFTMSSQPSVLLRSKKSALGMEPDTFECQANPNNCLRVRHSPSS
jgi:hypothetical protein